MRKSVLLGLGLAAVLAPPGTAAVFAETGTAWLHIRVEETHKPSKVSVNLPMNVVQAALQATPELLEKHGKVHLGGHHGMKVADFRRIWKQLAAVGDAEFVTVESEDENVRVRRQGDIVQILVDHKNRRPAEKAPEAGAKTEKRAEEKSARRGEEVRVEVPVSLVDALFSGEGEQLNVEAAVAELQKRRGDVVRVHDEDSHVRIWIDEQNAPPSAKE